MEDRRAKETMSTQILTGLPVGGEYVDRYKRLKNHHMSELQDQIDEKRKKSELEKKVYLKSNLNS